MKKVHMMAAAVLALTAAAAQAQTSTLTFDNLNGIYGDGNSLGPLTGDGQTIAYVESGYMLTLHTTNDPSAFFGAHIGDAGGSQTFNWHDDGDNLYGAYVTLSKVGGGSFNLVGFDYASNDLTVTGGGTSLSLSGAGNVPANLLKVNSVTFSSLGYTYNQLDNVQVSGAVPEPASWALMLGGFGLVGGAMRSRKRSISFA
jgi:hypothetical protein